MWVEIKNPAFLWSLKKFYKFSFIIIIIIIFWEWAKSFLVNGDTLCIQAVCL